MSAGMLQRIGRAVGVEDLVERLSTRLPASDLQSLLLEVYRRVAGSRSAADVLADYRRNRFVAPAGIDPREQVELDRAAYRLLPEGFEPIELSPLAPLAVTSALAALDQNVAVATIRNTEVVSDSTNVMALECAVRRRQLLRGDPRSTRRVRLAASHRLVRAQKYGPGFSAHFRIFSLVAAGRDEGSLRFESEALAEQVGFYARLVRDAAGLPAERIRASLTPIGAAARDALEGRVLPQLRDALPGVDVRLDTERTRAVGYYAGACFWIHAADAEGRWVELADGGFTDWTQQLLGSRKERLLIGGMGTERLLPLAEQGWGQPAEA